MQPVQKRALCIQIAGCYGQIGNGGQGTDRGRGPRPVDSRHPHHGKLSSAERLVPHGCGDTRRSRAHTDTRTHAAMLLRGEHICLFTRMNTVFVRQTITYFYSVVFTWSSTWFAALAAARLGAFSAKRGCSKTRQTGSENTGIIKDKRSFEHHLFAELTCSL